MRKLLPTRLRSKRKDFADRLIEIGADQKEFTHMMMQEGEHWICSNADCRCEVVVTAGAGSKEGRNPTCSCGFAMRKRYSAPIFTAIPERDRANGIQELISLRVR